MGNIKIKIMKKINIIVILLGTFLVVNAQKKNILLGKWVIIKTISADPDYNLNNEENKQFLGDTIVFKNDRIIAPKNKTFYGGCTSPNYKFKIVNALKYYDNDREYLKLIGCNTTNIEVVETTCGLPFTNIHIIDKSYIDIGVDSYIYFLKKIN